MGRDCEGYSIVDCFCENVRMVWQWMGNIGEIFE